MRYLRKFNELSDYNFIDFTDMGYDFDYDNSIIALTKKYYINTDDRSEFLSIDGDNNRSYFTIEITNDEEIIDSNGYIITEKGKTMINNIIELINRVKSDFGKDSAYVEVSSSIDRDIKHQETYEKTNLVFIWIHIEFK